MNSVSPRWTRLTGIALIVVPLVALLLKLCSFGWLMVIIILGPSVVLAIGYVLQIVIAWQGFLAKRDLLGAARQRATTAAWVSLAGILLLGLTLPDGGDTGWGSTLQVWLGAYGADGQAVHAATDLLTNVLSGFGAAAWLLGWGWLAVEWVGAHARRRKQQLGLQ